MDFFKDLANANKHTEEQTAAGANTVTKPGDNDRTERSSGGLFGGLSGKLNEAMGGGKKSEANEGMPV
jgi:hypothetical protein